MCRLRTPTTAGCVLVGAAPQTDLEFRATGRQGGEGSESTSKHQDCKHSDCKPTKSTCTTEATASDGKDRDKRKDESRTEATASEGRAGGGGSSGQFCTCTCVSREPVPRLHDDDGVEPTTTTKACPVASQLNYRRTPCQACVWHHGVMRRPEAAGFFPPGLPGTLGCLFLESLRITPPLQALLPPPPFFLLRGAGRRIEGASCRSRPVPVALRGEFFKTMKSEDRS